ncbi:MAG: ComF family protein [Clostridia bacterium]|nr:ComF family protein [Clostridia bacterium]
MKLPWALRNFFMPPICPGCRECIATKYGAKNETCADCGMKWTAARATLCPVCSEPWHSCLCTCKKLETAGASAHIKLVPYTSREGIGNRVVHYIKTVSDKRIFSMLGRELAREIDLYFDRMGLRREDAILTYAPRRRRTVRLVGFDQAKLLTQAVSKHSGIPVVKLLRRKGRGGRAQKRLDAATRAKNVHGMFELCSGVELSGKTVLLIDDLVTTGATAGECVRLLKKKGAALVICASVAYTEKE